jgi:hypothetical protein
VQECEGSDRSATASGALAVPLEISSRRLGSRPAYHFILDIFKRAPVGLEWRRSKRLLSDHSIRLRRPRIFRGEYRSLFYRKDVDLTLDLAGGAKSDADAR